jgi:3-keto-disaccharide hydrolase
MRAIFWLGIIGLAVIAGAETIRFDSGSPGSLPAGWTVVMPGAGTAPKWELRRDASAPSKPNVLAQVSADNSGGPFPMAILNTANYRDGEVSVKFKTVSGKKEQAAGVVWRYRDPANYYLVRANALENNIVLYKVQNGQWTSLTPRGKPAKTYGVRHRIQARTWNILKVSFRKARFEVYFDHRKVFEVEDGTFSGPGKVGLWTKADSVTYFDDFQFAGK